MADGAGQQQREKRARARDLHRADRGRMCHPSHDGLIGDLVPAVHQRARAIRRERRDDDERQEHGRAAAIEIERHGSGNTNCWPNAWAYAIAGRAISATPAIAPAALARMYFDDANLLLRMLELVRKSAGSVSGEGQLGTHTCRERHLAVVPMEM